MNLNLHSVIGTLKLSALSITHGAECQNPYISKMASTCLFSGPHCPTSLTRSLIV